MGSESCRGCRIDEGFVGVHCNALKGIVLCSKVLFSKCQYKECSLKI